ncbi:MAG: DUF58 domain-containing protein [Methanospirillum sp.]|nr:DUF58 domain-containing protein [Methanospirillum sp.]
MSDTDSYADLIRKIRTIDIITRARVCGQQAGVHISLFKGQGVEFSDIREYIPGDDIRAIDWKITARYGIPYIKEFVEERDHILYIIMDLSGSGSFGHTVSKFSTMLSILATLVFSAVHYHDRVGLFLVTDTVEHYIPARSGRSHAVHAIQTVLTHKPSSSRSDLRPACTMLLQRAKRMSSVILLSDFFVPDCSRELSLLKKHHEVLSIRVTDPREHELPDVGLIELEDSETGEQILVDTSDPAIRKNYEEAAAGYEETIRRTMRRYRIPFLQVKSGEDCYEPLRQFLSLRPGGEL